MSGESKVDLLRQPIQKSKLNNMAWNPDIYNKFKSERFAPFYDLLALVKVKPGMQVIDLGCGTGELTRKLADHLPGSSVLGIDSSEEMLKDSVPFANGQAQFEHLSIEEQVNQDRKWDLVFSNAAIQWVDNHRILLPKIISTIRPGGQLLIQVPSQNHNLTNILLNKLADEKPYQTTFKGWTRISSVLEIQDYGQILFENGSKSMSVYEKIYPLVLPDTEALFNWVSGTALIPYLEKLDIEQRQVFIVDYRSLLQKNFSKAPVFYPFKRIIIEASF